MNSGEGSWGTIDSISSRDVDECLRMLEEVWPGADERAAGLSRQLGRFSIVRELGHGGFGVVFLAEDPLLERRVALKVPRVEVLSQSQGWRRFLREVRTASRLDHPNLVPLLEAGAIGPVGYIVSAFVEGPTLEQCLRQARTGAPARFSARLIATLAGAVEHVHERGILHRDLKPANILMQAPECGGDLSAHQPWDEGGTQSWVPRICDFGLATLREIDGDETRTRLAAGSPSYMSPEQAEARHDDIGPATDIYGLGATLYQLLTGRPPFTGASELETLRRVVADEPIRPRHLRPEIPSDLETICLKCLAKRPEQRYTDAAALGEDLHRFLEGRPILARPVPAWERGWKWARRHPALAALATATTLAILGGLGGLIWHESVLRQLNEQLRQEARRAEHNAHDALEQRKLLEERERMLRRQLTGHQVFAAQQAVFAGNFELAHRMLDSADVGLKSSPKRGFAWSYLWRFVRDRLEVLPGHGDAVDKMTTDASGQWLATADDSGGMLISDVLNGTSRRLSHVPMAGVHCVALSANGGKLAACSRRAREILLWDVASSSLIGRIADGSDTAVSALIFGEDGKRLLVVRDQPDRRALPIAGWDITSRTGAFRRLSQDEIEAITAEVIDERLVTFASLLDAEPSTQLSASARVEFNRSLRLRPPRGFARTRDDAMTVVALGNGQLNVYRTSIGLLLASCRFGIDATAIVLHDPSKYEKGSQPQDRERPELMAKRLVPNNLQPNPDSGIVVRLDWCDQFAFSPDGRKLAVWRESVDQLNVIDLATHHEDKRYNLGKIDGQSTMCFTTGCATLALGGLDHVVRLWHLSERQNPVVLAGHAPKEAWSVAFTPDCRTLASSGDDGCIRLWDVETGKERDVLRGHQSLVSSIAFAPDARSLLSGSFDRKERVIIWDLATKRPKFSLRGHTGFVRAVAYSPDGRTAASAGDDSTIMLWETNEGRCVATIQMRERVNCLAFSPDGHTLAAGERGGRITLLDATTHTCRTIESVASASSLTFSSDGSQIHSGHDGGLVLIWDIATGNRLRELSGHYVNAFCVAVSADGTTLASAGHDRTVILWDPATGQQLLRLTDCKAQVNAVAFSSDGQLLAAADHSGAITIWQAGRAPK